MFEEVITKKDENFDSLDGSYVYVMGVNNFIDLNPTFFELGKGSSLYYSLMFQFGKWNYQTAKVNEHFYINPNYREYYAGTIAQKEELQGKIKAGLQSAASAVADYELLRHDERKYEEMMDYFNHLEEGRAELEKAKANEEKKIAQEKIDLANYSLRSIFIDQVDVHTGEGVAMKLITSRWPTIIVDFMKLIDEDTTVEKIMQKNLGISKAEAHVLAVKNDLFLDWKKMFKSAVAERFKNISSLVNARRKSIEEYKNWMRPYVEQQEMMEMGPPGRRSFFHPNAHATSEHEIRVWTWRPFYPKEMRKLPTRFLQIRKKFKLHYLEDEIKNLETKVKKGTANEKEEAQLNDTKKKLEKVNGAFEICPYDDFVIKKVKELSNLPSYKTFLTPAKFEKQALSILSSIASGNDKKMEIGARYYVFFDIKFTRSLLSLPNMLADDANFFIRAYMMSQNVLLVRLLELWADGQKFDKKIDELLGLRSYKTEEKAVFGEIGGEVEKRYKYLYESLKGKAEEGKKSHGPIKEIGNATKKINEFFKRWGIEFQLFRGAGGPYETTGEDRVTKMYLKPLGQENYVEVTGFLEKQIGVNA